MVINTVGHLAEAAWHHPDLTASYAWVEVRLRTHRAKGITEKDFELAAKIEEVVHWRPRPAARWRARPADQRFAYIKYEWLEAERDAAGPCREPGRRRGRGRRAARGAARVAIGGLGADIAGAEAAIRLARQVGAALDHAEAAPALRDLT